MTDVLNASDEALMMLIVETKFPKWYKKAEGAGDVEGEDESEADSGGGDSKEERNKDILNQENMGKFQVYLKNIGDSRKNGYNNMKEWDALVQEKCVRNMIDLRNDKEDQGETDVAKKPKKEAFLLYSALIMGDEEDEMEGINQLGV